MAELALSCEFCGHADHPRLRRRRKNALRCGNCQPCRNTDLDRERCRRWHANNWQAYIAANPNIRIARNERNKKYRAKLWDEFFAAYGQRCECCRETQRFFLTIEHIGNDGKAARLQNIQSHQRLLALKRLGWPSTVVVRCFNCNCGRERNGGICPHRMIEHG